MSTGGYELYTFIYMLHIYIMESVIKKEETSVTQPEKPEPFFHSILGIHPCCMKVVPKMMRILSVIRDFLPRPDHLKKT